MGKIYDEKIKFCPRFRNISADFRLILERLFLDDLEESKNLKSLILIPQKNCITKRSLYEEVIESFDISSLIKEDYISFTPNLKIDFNDDKQVKIILSVNQFVPTKNPSYYSYLLNIYVLTSYDCWMLDNFDIRSMAISGIIAGKLGGRKLTGIGETSQPLIIQYAGNQLGGYISSYTITQGADDTIEKK